MFKMGVVGLNELSTSLQRLGIKIKEASNQIGSFEELIIDIETWWEQFHLKLEAKSGDPSMEELAEVQKKFSSTANIAFQILQFVKSDIGAFYNLQAEEYQRFLVKNNFPVWDGELKALAENSMKLKRLLHGILEDHALNQYVLFG